MSDTDKMLWSPIETMTLNDTWGLAPKRTPGGELDKNAFLQLLITQMKYQDPLNPMDDRDFMGQMAQFSALEQMQNLNATFAKTQAYGMIGKNVEAVYKNPASGEYEEVTGLVSAVTTRGSNVYLYVNGHDLPLDSVTAVIADNFTEAQLDAILEQVYNTRNQDYVGRYIQALLMNKEGRVTEYVEGIVDYVKFNGNQSILVVGNKEVFPNEVASVSDKPFLYGEIGRHVTNGGGAEIKKVNIYDGKAYLEFANGTSVQIDKINYIMEALQYVGKPFEHNAISGRVESITISGTPGIPFFNIRKADGEMTQLSYILYLTDIKS